MDGWMDGQRGGGEEGGMEVWTDTLIIKKKWSTQRSVFLLYISRAPPTITKGTWSHACIEIESHATPLFVINMASGMDHKRAHPTTTTTSCNMAPILRLMLSHEFLDCSTYLWYWTNMLWSIEGFGGKRALGFLIKIELCRKRSKFCMQFCLGALNNVLYVFLLKFSSFTRYYVCKKACICGLISTWPERQ